MQKNVTGQKIRVFAFDLTDNTPKTGDAAQITVKVSNDWAAAGALTDVNPTEVEDGYYIFDVTQAESNYGNIDVYPESSTGDIQVIGVPGTIVTVPENHADLGIESDGDITKVNLCASTTLTDTVTTYTGNTLQTANVADLITTVGTPVDLGDGAFIGEMLTSIAGKTGDAASYDRTTDSQEAIRDRGDAAWTSDPGEGAITFTYTITSSAGGDPIADVLVWVTTDIEGTNTVASSRTDNFGVVVFTLDAGTYYLWRKKGGYQFVNPDTEVVA